MTLAWLLDTSIISAPIAKVPDRRVIERLETEGAACAIAAPVWHELAYGCRRLPAGRRRDVIERYLQDVVLRSFPVLPYDERAADWHGKERARLEKAGRPVPFVDGQIAAIAATNDLAVVTANLKDFKFFRGLSVLNWASPPSKRSVRGTS